MAHDTELQMFLRQVDEQLSAIMQEYRGLYQQISAGRPEHETVLKEFFGRLFSLQTLFEKHHSLLLRQQSTFGQQEQMYQALYKSGLLLDASLETTELLELAMDTVIEMSGAARGFLALVDESGAYTTRTARNFDKQNIPQPEREISDSVIRRVLENRQAPHETARPLRNELLETSSILRADTGRILCVPVLNGENILGVLYLDGLREGTLQSAFILVKQFAVQLARFLKSSEEITALRQSNARLHASLKGRYRFENIICKNRAMLELLNNVAIVAKTRASVLLSGETGTGKDLIARAIHENSGAYAAAYIEVDCGALPGSLIESELFGYARGAFTGAQTAKTGLLEAAEGGTLFLDEIGNLPMESQAKLLRALQQRKIRRLGETEERDVSFRLIAATSTDIEKAVENGSFRRDLYYRINTVALDIPPLRERKDDIYVLAAHFLRKYAGEHNKDAGEMSAEYLEALESHSWPGNVRELEHVIERSVIFSSAKTLTPAELPQELRPKNAAVDAANAPISLEESVNRFKKAHIEQILQACGGKKVEAARRLQINRSYLFQLIKQLDIRDAGE